MFIGCNFSKTKTFYLVSTNYLVFYFSLTFQTLQIGPHAEIKIIRVSAI